MVGACLGRTDYGRSSRFVKADIAPLLGVSRSGSLFVVAHVGILDVHIASIDLRRRRLSGPPQALFEASWITTSGPPGRRDGKTSCVRVGSRRQRTESSHQVNRTRSRPEKPANSKSRWALRSDSLGAGRTSFLACERQRSQGGARTLSNRRANRTRRPGFPLTRAVRGGAGMVARRNENLLLWGGTDCPGREGTFLLEGDLTTG